MLETALALAAAVAAAVATWCAVYVWLERNEPKLPPPVKLGGGKDCPACGAEANHQRLDRRAR